MPGRRLPWRVRRSSRVVGLDGGGMPGCAQGHPVAHSVRPSHSCVEPLHTLAAQWPPVHRKHLLCREQRRRDR